MKSFFLTVKKEYAASAKTLFAALSRGALFAATGPLTDSYKFDFHVGGEYRIDWPKAQYGYGKFTEIVPNEKIVFTWTGESTVGKFNNTIVTVTLRSISENRTELQLHHAGFDNEAVCKDHEIGWTDTLKDFKH